MTISVSKSTAHHYHDTLVKPPFGDKYPEDVVQKGAAQKYCSNLVIQKEQEVASETNEKVSQ